MRFSKYNTYFVCVAYLAIILLVFLNLNNSFFWDTVQLASGHADFYFSTNFTELLLPNEIDSGHIPAFGMYIALLWKLFGRSLQISHLAMLPFAIGIVWQLYKLCRKFIPEKYKGIALLLILADPTLLSQITLVSPDVALLFFFFLAINAVLKNKKWLLSISIFLLFMTSMRGMMVALCLLSLDVYCNVNLRNPKKEVLRNLVKRSLIYLPAMFLFISFNAYHYFEKGWIGYHKDSPWAQCFKPVEGINGFAFNIGLYGWRLLDFGRIGIWIVFFILLAVYKKRLLKSRQHIMLGLFAVALMVILPLNMLWAKNLMGHRYFMPCYLTFALFCASILFSDFVTTRLKYFLSALWIVVLTSGNFWIYPPKIAQGWDATLAHFPYYKLRSEAILYLDKKKIDFKEVQTFFPNTATLDRIDLNNDLRNFDNFDCQTDYVLFSNVYNVDDAVYEELLRKYEVVKQFEDHGVFVNIYKKRQL